MTQTILIRRSVTPAKVPTTAQLSLGELALNTNDGKLFFKKDVSGVQSIVEVGATTLTGDVTGSGNDTITVTLANSGVTAGTYKSVTVDAKGRVTAGTSPTTLSGFGITDGVNSSLLGAANGVATLDSAGKVPAAQLPSYVDDVLEYAKLAAFPATGTAGIIYVALDTNKTYRWSSTVYVEISASPGSTDAVAEGATNLYFTAARAQAAVTSITGNAATATKLATARSIAMTGDLTWSIASFDGSANVTAAGTLAASGVTAGTYPKVTVDSKGRVTAGAVLAATDIPALDWTKITTGKPTTLSGYGITDAAPLTHTTDATLHLTTAQNTWIDAITATSTEVNYLSGVTSAIQTQLNNKQASLGFTAENAANKGVANGYAGLDATGKVPAAQLPSYVDDVLEYTNLAAFPATGVSSTIYVALDTNKIYRWTGTVYVEISPVVGNSDTATKLATARTITLSGDVTGSTSFDGSANVTITTALAANSVILGTDTTGNYVGTIAAGTAGAQTGTSGLTITAVAGEGTAATLALSTTGVTAGTYKSVTVDAQGRVSAGTNPTTLAGYGITDAYNKTTIDTMTLDGGSY